jgi:hypothetical protein
LRGRMRGPKLSAAGIAVSLLNAPVASSILSST